MKNLTRHGTGSADFFLDAFCSISFPFCFHFVSCFVPVSFRKTSFWAAPGHLLGRLGGVLGTSWGRLAALGRLRSVLRRSCGRLGGRLWSLLGASWGILGASWGVLGASWGRRLGASWERLGASWPRLGASFGRMSFCKGFSIDFGFEK